MARGKEKVRAGFYIEKEVLEMADSLLPAANVRSRNEFVTEALKFYCGYLNSGKAEDYLLQSLSSVLTSTVQDTENRICRLLFKLAVEQDMVMNVLAAGMEIPDEQLKALRGRCIQDVKKTSGSISLDDAVRYQRGSL